VQEDLIELIKWAAEHGDAEAKKIAKSNDPTKFITFALYDVPGTAWGIAGKTNTTPFVYNNLPDYWDRVYKNVEAAFQRGLLSEDQWQLWLKRYKNKDYYLGLKFANTPQVDSTWNFYKKRNEIDLQKMKEQVIDLVLPGKSFFEGR
jgi:hypothetical protein